MKRKILPFLILKSLRLGCAPAPAPPPTSQPTHPSAAGEYLHRISCASTEMQVLADVFCSCHCCCNYLAQLMQKLHRYLHDHTRIYTRVETTGVCVLSSFQSSGLQNRMLRTSPIYFAKRRHSPPTSRPTTPVGCERISAQGILRFN